MTEPTDIEKKNLEAHVELCAERYRALETKLEDIDNKICALEKLAKEVHNCVHSINEKYNDRVIRWGGSIIMILLGIIGWLASHYITKIL